ncbi:MAG: hypothetical protein KDC75_24795, partial [Phaeodactylibacter sp.]|nr:hypothetical protein [Phaeodactylibacter sp.]
GKTCLLAARQAGIGIKWGSYSSPGPKQKMNCFRLDGRNLDKRLTNFPGSNIRISSITGFPAPGFHPFSLSWNNNPHFSILFQSGRSCCEHPKFQNLL